MSGAQQARESPAQPVIPRIAASRIAGTALEAGLEHLRVIVDKPDHQHERGDQQN